MCNSDGCIHHYIVQDRTLYGCTFARHKMVVEMEEEDGEGSEKTSQSVGVILMVRSSRWSCLI